MKDVTASMAKQSSRQQCGVLRSSENKAISQSKAIQHYYGEIGIAAVAAAVRYQGDFKNAAYAPVAIEWYDRHGAAVWSYCFRPSRKGRSLLWRRSTAIFRGKVRHTWAINAMANETPRFDHDTIDPAPQFYSCIGLSWFEEVGMEFTQRHEKYAEKCVAMALSSEQDVDKALWLSLAQSWARLGEQVASVEHQSGAAAP
jgi:hypothetical protein